MHPAHHSLDVVLRSGTVAVNDVANLLFARVRALKELLLDVVGHDAVHALLAAVIHGHLHAENALGRALLEVPAPRIRSSSRA